MGVYIKGMEMPRHGHTITITIVGSGQAYVEYFDCRPHVEETIEYTAVPVPEHGRLIDADVLITRYEKQRAEDGDIICDERAFPSDYEKAMYRYSRNSDIISALKSQAAVITAEEGE